MAVKMVIAAESNAGKTTLTKGMKDTLVISFDGKRYSYATPHASPPSVASTDELVEFVAAKAAVYEEKFGSMPKIIVFDSVSRIYEALYDSCSARYTGFAIYSQLDKEIKALADFIEYDLVGNGISVVIISHALYDSETQRYNLVGKGSFAKIGGFLSIVDESIFLEPKNDKRIVHFRSGKLPARTLQEELPDKMDVKDFNLTEHIEMLLSRVGEASAYEL